MSRVGSYNPEAQRVTCSVQRALMLVLVLPAASFCRRTAVLICLLFLRQTPPTAAAAAWIIRDAASEPNSRLLFIHLIFNSAGAVIRLITVR